MPEIEIKKFGDRERSPIFTGSETLVQQNLHEETDINRIMARYAKTGVINHLNTYQGEYGDFSDIPDFKTGLERVQQAEVMFMSLPSRIRERFGNDPGKYIEFAMNPENLEEMRKMGLAPQKAEGEAERPPLGAKPVADPPKEAPKPVKGDQ